MRCLALCAALAAVAVLAPPVGVVAALLLAFWVRVTWGRPNPTGTEGPGSHRSEKDTSDAS